MGSSGPSAQPPDTALVSPSCLEVQTLFSPPQPQTQAAVTLTADGQLQAVLQPRATLLSSHCKHDYDGGGSRTDSSHVFITINEIQSKRLLLCASSEGVEGGMDNNSTPKTEVARVALVV